MPFPFVIPAFFFASWLVMVFWGMVSPGVGAGTIGYPTAMLVTIGLWLAVFPVARGKAGPPGPMGRMGPRFRGEPAGNWETTTEDSVNISTSFSAVSRRVDSQSFRGGSVSAQFGGVKLDLRGSRLSEQGAVLDVRAFFGGVELFVPEDWDVQLEVSASMGGVEDGRARPAPHVQGAPRLVVRGTAFLGGVHVKDG